MATQALCAAGVCKYLECGIFAHGFARARCDDCGHDYFVAFSRKGQGTYPSCNTRRMVKTAAHLSDHVFPACQCASGCCLSRSTALLLAARRGSAQHGAAHFPGGHRAKPPIRQPWCGDVDKVALYVGAVDFIHHFSFSLDGHVHSQVCPGPLARTVDGVEGDHRTSLKRVFVAVGFRCTADSSRYRLGEVHRNPCAIRSDQRGECE